MKHNGKKITALSLAGTMVLTAAVPAMAAPSPSRGNLPKNQTASVYSIAYVRKNLKVLVSGTARTYTNGTAALVSVSKTSKKYSFVRPSRRIRVGKVTYLVTAINNKAFKNAKNVKTIVLPKSIRKIKAGAFTGTKKLTTIKLLRTGNTKISKKAFKGINTKKITVKVSKKMSTKTYKSIKKQLKAAGFKGKIQRK